MPKKKTKKTPPPLALEETHPELSKIVIAFVDKQRTLLHIVDSLEADYGYVEAVETLTDEILRETFPPPSTFDLEGLRAELAHIDDACQIVAGARKAGFLVGFECCRRLMGEE